MPITHHVNDLVDKARETINQVSATEAARMFDADEALLIDIRESHELKDRGIIEEAHHAPRSMLEFWADPHSPYHKSVFSSDGKLILFCASGIRSALATKTLADMGMTNAVNMDGGLTKWRMQGLPVEYLN